MGNGFLGVSSTTWKGFFFGGTTNGITGCSSSPAEGNVGYADAVSDSHPGDLSNIYPDVKLDITDVSSWLDVFDIQPPDTQPDIVEIPPEIIEVSPETEDAAADQEAGDGYYDAETATCVPQAEIPYDHIAQQCTLDLADLDGDGYCLKDYEIEDAAKQCAVETGKYGTDCDDKDAKINPAQIESCNNQDDNCDGKIDEGLTKITYSGTKETDGIGECQPQIEFCVAGEYKLFQKEVLPQAESCDNKDNNCDGKTDEGQSQEIYTGDPKTNKVGLCQPLIVECKGGKTEVTQQMVLPQAEVCDSKDNNCNGKTDDGLVKVSKCECTANPQAFTCLDQASSSQCFDAIVPTADPTRMVIGFNYKAQADSCNSNPKLSVSVKGNQVAAFPFPCASGGYASLQFCLPPDTKSSDISFSLTSGDWCSSVLVNSAVVSTVNPDTKEACNGIDDNCNGQTDEGLLKVTYSGNDPATQNFGVCQPKKEDCVNAQTVTLQNEITPTPETCNNKDDNCDGNTDENLFQSYYTAGYGQNVGECKAGSKQCEAGQWNVVNPEITPKVENCDNKDNDCNGQTDENLAPVETYTGQPPTTKNVGECKPQIKVCQNGILQITQFQVIPQPEIACNDKDENCDGIVFQGTDKDGDTFKKEGGLCGPVDCDDNNKLIYPGAPETLCDGVDYNCDGKTQEYKAIGGILPVSDNDGFYSDRAQVAWDGNNYFVAFSDARTSKGKYENEIWGAKLDSNGNKTMGDQLLKTNGAYVQSLTWDNNIYDLLWNQNSNNSVFTNLSKLDSNGNNKGNDVIIGEMLSQVSMSWKGAGFGLAFAHAKGGPIEGLYFRKLDSNGNQVGGEKTINNYPGDQSISLSLVWDGLGYGISYESFQDAYQNGWILKREIYFVKLDGEGDKISPAINISKDPKIDGFNPITAYNQKDGEYGIVWMGELEKNNYTCEGLYFVRMDSSGNQLTEAIELTGCPSYYLGYSTFSFRWNGTEYDLIWSARDISSNFSDIYFARFNAKGNKIDNNIKITNSSGWSRYPSFVWNQKEYGIVFNNNTFGLTGAEEVYFARVGCQ